MWFSVLGNTRTRHSFGGKSSNIEDNIGGKQFGLGMDDELGLNVYCFRV